MENIEDLLRKRKELLDQIDTEIQSSYTKPVTLLFTDIVGSTTYFEEMGDIAGRQMIQTHNDLLFPVIAEAGGRVIKTIGDSIMASFEDPESGVGCAIAMQKRLAEYNAGREKKQKIRVRMGLHFGRAVVDEKDLFGDVVNTAARVEARADGEEIIISSELADKCDASRFPIVFLGSDTVKGKAREIRFFMVNWNGRREEELLASWEGRTKAKAAPALSANEKSGRKYVVKGTLPVKNPSLSSRHGNPYLNRVMISHPSMFFGRVTLVKRIMGRLSSEKPQSVSIVGERRIGKSSLLNFLTFESTRKEHLGDTGKYVFAFVDFQQVRSGNPDEVAAAIFQELRKSVECDSTGREDFDGIRSLCECLTDDGYKLILLFDEFESITKNPAIGPDFYSYFRSLANNYGVAFVTASGRNLKDMCVSRQISDSPFFNIFAVNYVGLFGRDEARRLVTGPSAEYGIPLAPVADAVLDEGGLYPFFLQMMCGSWFDFLESEAKTADDFAGKPTPRGVLSLFREESEPHFEFVVETLADDERAVLGGLSGGVQPKLGDAGAESLERKGYIVANESGGFAPFGKEFGLFVAKRLG